MPFEIKDRAAAGRIGRLRTGHGIVTTPTLLPVVNPNIDLVAPREMEERFGCEMVITNSYVIHKHEALRTQALRHGIHDLLGWDGPVMTDSGTFQMYVYGDVEVGAEEIVEFQAAMGVDVATCLDLFVTPEMSRQEAEQAVATTLERTRASVEVLARHRGRVSGGGRRGGQGAEAEAATEADASGDAEAATEADASGDAEAATEADASGDADAVDGRSASAAGGPGQAPRHAGPGGPGHAGTILNATVQGGIHADLRQACAGAYRELDVGYHTIGGVVPLMEQQMYPELVEVILHSQAHLRKDRPVHLFGAGHPLVFPLATALGCDLFDSSSYAKYAKAGRVMTPEGTLHVEDLAEWPFASRFLDAWSPAELHKALQGRPRGKGVPTDAADAAGARRRIEARESSDPRFAAERALALHNLDVCFTDIRRIRQAIRDGVLWELVEQRAACHPMLAAATRRLGDPGFQAWLEEREPLSGARALRYTGSLTHRRPAFRRIRSRLMHRYVPLGEPMPAMMETPYAAEGEEKREVAMHKEPGQKPYGPALGTRLDAEQEHAVINALGPTPLGLDEAYPFAQSVLPRLDGLDRGHMGWVGETKDLFLAAHDLMPAIPGPPSGEGLDRDMLQVLRTADWQFGAGAGAALVGMLPPGAVQAALVEGAGGAGDAAAGRAAKPDGARDAADHAAPADGTPDATGGDRAPTAPGGGAHLGDSAMEPGAAARGLGPLIDAVAESGHRPAGDFACKRSRKTDKLRTVHRGDGHILSLRAQDGFFTLKPAGAAILHAALPQPAMRVTVEADSVAFNRDGKSVFARFVTDADPNLRPGDECLVVDGDDRLVAVGQVLLNREEMLDFQTGMAVKVRDGIAA